MPAAQPSRLILRLGAGLLLARQLLAGLLRPRANLGVDFHTYLAAARVGMTDGWSAIYDQGLVVAAQHELASRQYGQAFLSPPAVAWLASALSALPYQLAYEAWALLSLAILMAALTWSAPSGSPPSWALALAAMSSWWVIEAIQVGQVVPLVAAIVLVGWRLLRDNREFASGLVFGLILLKPNTAFLVVPALLFAGRFRALAGVVFSGVALSALSVGTVGIAGISDYLGQLRGPLPGGYDVLSLHRALGIGGIQVTALKGIIVALTMATASLARQRPGRWLPAAIVGSLLVSPYLHTSDLCLFTVAGWMAWHEWTSAGARAPLAVIWMVSAPLTWFVPKWPAVNRWPLIEVAVVLAMAVSAVAWSRRRGQLTVAPWYATPTDSGPRCAESR